jgi:hypothetical protein
MGARLRVGHASIRHDGFNSRVWTKAALMQDKSARVAAIFDFRTGAGGND